MRKLLFFLVLMTASPLWGASEVGQVVDLVGEVTVAQEGKPPASAVFKEAIHLGDVIETKKAGAIKILFHDDTLLTVKEDSKTLISEFLFQPQEKHRKIIFDVPYGKIRSVVSRFFGNDEKVEIKTPTAVAGIRGTDVGATVTKKKTIFYCFEGLFDVYNLKLPAQPIAVTEGLLTEVVQNLPPTPAVSIPPAIQDNKIQIFDIPMTKPEAPAATSQSQSKSEIAAPAKSDSQNQTAGSQVAEASHKEITPEALVKTVAAVATLTESTTQSSSRQTTLLNTTNALETGQNTTTNSIPASTNVVTQILPGGTTSASNTSSITINFPSF